MSNPIISIHNLETGEETRREMTDEEIAAFAEMQPTQTKP